ncbi:MAG TPA: hypothetical protein VGY30_03710 [Solirubrobacteraceae bacterium]|jgi:hypothetical protein|nr:hypothetical protein [Solirubrobacteraceae bacterium]
MKVKHFMVLALIACSATFGAQAVLAAKPRHHRNRHHHQYGFAVLEHGSAKISDARQQILGIPSNAVLAESVGGDNIYVFQRVHKLEAQTCVADEGGAEMAGGGACGSTEAAEREGLSLIHPKPDGTQRLIVLVPNGVKKVSVTTRNNGSTAVAATDNVVVIEGDLTAYDFVSPSGSDVSVSLEGI